MALRLPAYSRATKTANKASQLVIHGQVASTTSAGVTIVSQCGEAEGAREHPADQAET